MPIRAALGNAFQRVNSHIATNPASGSSTPSNEEPMGWRDLAVAAGRAAKGAGKAAYEGGYRVSSAVRARATGSSTESETWRQWWERRREEVKGAEKIALFPGFAVRRHDDFKDVGQPHHPSDAPFSVELFVEGYASSLRPPELATRYQKAFMRIAKGYAALPKLPMGNSGTDDDSNNLQPDETNEEFENDLKDIPEFHGFHDQPPNGTPSIHSVNSTATSRTQASLQDLAPAELARLHANLDMRLQPFWSSIVADRTVRISVFVPSTSLGSGDSPYDVTNPLATKDLKTNLQGYFSHRFQISYETLCHHPPALQMVFGDQNPLLEDSLVVRADLLPAEQQPRNGARPGAAGTLQPHLDQFSRSSPYGTTSAASSTGSLLLQTPFSETRIAITSAKVRLISDIDDTVKRLDFVQGAKVIFRNTFVHPLEDLVVPGMGEWYSAMSQMGVRFHYVSNSPFEMLPVLQEFFGIAGLPAGHMKLKYWGGGRSILGGLWEDAAERKRSRVLDVLNDFPESRFLLVGDSGEQDLELYSAIAKDRPQQVLAIFIRDVSSAEFLSVLKDRPSEPFGTPCSHDNTPKEQSLNERWDSLQTSMDEMNLSSSSRASTRKPESPKASLDGRQPPPPRHPSRRPSTAPSAGTPNGSTDLRRQSSASINMSSSQEMTQEAFSEKKVYHEEPSRFESFQSESPAPMAPSQIPPNPNSSLRPSPPRQQSSTGPRPPGSYFGQVDANGRLTNPRATSSRFGRRNTEEDAIRVAAEKKRNDFKWRIESARALIPHGTVLRIFKEPEECVESWEILDRLGLREQTLQ